MGCTVSDSPDIRLDAEQWMARADKYAERAETFVAPHLKRARAGEAHPVWDFLFRSEERRVGKECVP